MRQSTVCLDFTLLTALFGRNGALNLIPRLKEMDPKVVRFCQMLNVPASADSFRDPARYRDVESLLKEYSASTSEDYIWRLCRFLSASPGFPDAQLQRYKKLLTYYKELYP